MKTRTYIQPLIEIHNLLTESFIAETQGDGHGGGDPVRPPGFDEANTDTWDDEEFIGHSKSLWE